MRSARMLAAAAVLLVWTAVAGAKEPPVPMEAMVVPTGAGPCGVTAARDGNLWVGVYGTGNILRIDSRTNRITKRIRVGRWACRLAVDKRAIWITRDQASRLVRVDRRTGRQISYEVGASPFDVLLAKGSIWVSSYDLGIIAQIDATRRRPTRIFRDGGFPAGVALCGGSIWIGHGRDITWLTAIAPKTHRITRADTGVGGPAWPRCVRGELWVTTPDSVLRLDAYSGVLRARIRLGGTPVEAIAGPDGLVWVTDKERSLVFRIDPASNTVVDSFAAGPGAYAMARVGESVWITSFAGSDVRRYSTRG